MMVSKTATMQQKIKKQNIITAMNERHVEELVHYYLNCNYPRSLRIFYRGLLQ